MTRPVVQLFGNPRAGRRSRRESLALADAFRAAGAEVLVTASVAGALRIDPRAAHVCAVGGDGTLRHVVEAARHSHQAVSISAYPAGTINLLARECDYARDPARFARRVLDGDRRRPHPLALVGDTPLVICASVGPDSLVVERLSPLCKRLFGAAAYVLAFARLLLDWPRTALSVEHDGQRLACEAVYVAKGHYFAGPWSIAPEAALDQPLLHVVTLREASRIAAIRFAWTVLRRRPVTALPGVTAFRCTDLRIDAVHPLPVQGDGDIVAHLPVRIRLDGSALPFD